MNTYPLIRQRAYGRAGQLFLLLFLSFFSAYSQAPDIHVYNGLPAGDNAGVRNILYNNGLYVAVVNQPTRIFTSVDAENWTQVETFPSLVNINLVYGNGRYLMTWDADSGTIGSSTDLVHWTFQNAGTHALLRDLEFLNGSFYTVGDSATFLRSSDGQSWTAPHLEISAGVISYAQVVYGNGCFVITALDTIHEYVVHRSADLSDGSWTSIDIAGSNISIKFLKDRFYYLWDYETFYSTDGIDWSQTISWPNPQFPYPDQFQTMFSDGVKTYLITIGTGTGYYFTNIYASTDGQNFSGYASSQFIGSNAVYVGQNYYLLGYYGMAKSSDGHIYVPMGGNYSYLATNGSVYVAAGTDYNGVFFSQGLIGTSTDLVHWTNRTMDGLSAVGNLVYDGANFETGKWLSPDGINWSATGDDQHPVIAYGNGVYLTGNGGSYSYDKINWQTNPNQVFNGEQLNWVKFLHGHFILSGVQTYNSANTPNLLVSTDGVNWTDATPHLSFPETMTDVLYDSTKYYLMGMENDSTGKGVGFFSVTNTDISNPDGYTDKGGATGPVLFPTAFAWSNGHFAGGAVDSVNNTYVLYASDGIHWGAIPLNIVNRINAAIGRADSVVLIANGNVNIVANFAGGTLPLSLLDFNAVAQGGRSLLSWHTGEEENTSRFVIQRSTDALHWDSIGVVAAAGQSNVTLGYSFTDVSPKKGYDYYRLGMVDIDGRQQLSAVKRVWIGDAGMVRVYPNPVRDVLTLEMAEDGAGRVQLYNSAGAGVLAQEFSGYTVNLSLGALPVGVYHLVIRQNGKQYVQEIFHQ